MSAIVIMTDYVSRKVVAYVVVVVAIFAVVGGYVVLEDKEDLGVHELNDSEALFYQDCRDRGGVPVGFDEDTPPIDHCRLSNGTLVEYDPREY